MEGRLYTTIEALQELQEDISRKFEQVTRDESGSVVRRIVLSGSTNDHGKWVLARDEISGREMPLWLDSSWIKVVR